MNSQTCVLRSPMSGRTAILEEGNNGCPVLLPVLLPPGAAAGGAQEVLRLASHPPRRKLTGDSGFRERDFPLIRTYSPGSARRHQDSSCSHCDSGFNPIFGRLAQTIQFECPALRLPRFADSTVRGFARSRASRVPGLALRSRASRLSSALVPRFATWKYGGPFQAAWKSQVN